MSEPSLTALASAVCDGMRQLEALGLNRGTAGNLSARTSQGFLVTPSGIAADALTPETIVHMDTAGEVLSSSGAPSSEWRFHRDIYAARSDVRAIVHSHSSYATALSCHRRGVPSFHYMVAVAGGSDIRCAPYALFGSQALSDGALEALADRRACLLANHGQIAVGQNVAKAIALAVEVEELARQYNLAMAFGEPVLLNDTEMQAVLERFKTYGAGHGRD